MRIPRFWLASNSPRRRAMISWSGWRVELVSPQVDETILPEENPLDYVHRVARQKCLQAIDQAHSDDFVIAADTMVVVNGEILGKPSDAREAFKMLDKLRGKPHWVITALAVRKARDTLPLMDTCRSEVKMRTYSDEDIRAYIASGDPFDKAGAYAIQHPVFNPAENFRGCLASVMGLPLCNLERTLRKFDGYLPKDWAEICQRQLKYDCPISTRIMAGEDIG